ncbi:MAG: protein phosphatase 2C domain-containing protein [Anaerolineae bacterium]|nr:protein phosphatase 2C domain-containing protein [Anaerolineae bacterium]
MFEIGKATHAGIKRKEHPNQDSIGVVFPGFFNRKPPLLIVADGMGGYEGGAIASQMVVDVLMDLYSHNKAQNDYRTLLSDMILAAHEAVKYRIIDSPEIARMGSTVVAVILDDKCVYIGNVGDSRAYIINPDDVEQISWDHSFVGELVRQGIINEEQSLVHPKRNILTMSITAQRNEIEPYVSKHILKSGDCVLLCSDGLWGVVGIDEIKTTVLNNPAQLAAEKLIEMANENYGPDNISVIIARKK